MPWSSLNPCGKRMQSPNPRLLNRGKSARLAKKLVKARSRFLSECCRDCEGDSFEPWKLFLPDRKKVRHLLVTDELVSRFMMGALNRQRLVVNEPARSRKTAHVELLFSAWHEFVLEGLKPPHGSIAHMVYARKRHYSSPTTGLSRVTSRGGGGALISAIPASTSSSSRRRANHSFALCPLHPRPQGRGIPAIRISTPWGETAVARSPAGSVR